MSAATIAGMQSGLRRLQLEDLDFGEVLVAVEIPHADFVARFGAPNSDVIPGWDAPGPVELWYFELPWGHKIVLEYHLHAAGHQCHVHMQAFEIAALQLRHPRVAQGQVLRDQASAGSCNAVAMP